MTTKHTPGPWTLDDRGCKYIVHKPGDGYITRDICRMDSSTMAAFAQEANARLIAAAPDLLNAVLLLLGNPDNRISSADVNAARAAITKATGD